MQDLLARIDSRKASTRTLIRSPMPRSTLPLMEASTAVVEAPLALVPPELVMSVEESDAQLVERVQRGDKRAFDLLVVKYQHKVLKLIGRLISNPAEAEDVAQDAFIKAYRALKSFRGDSAFYTWLYRIAINTAKNALVSKGRRPHDFNLDLQDPEQYEMQARLQEGDTPEGLLLTEEIRSTVQGAMRDLPEDLRTAITLRELDGLS